MRSEIHELPRCAHRLDPRVSLRADLATPAGVLRVYSTHTSRDDCQTRSVAELALAQRGPLPSLVLGDLNTGARAMHAYLGGSALGPGWVDRRD